MSKYEIGEYNQAVRILPQFSRSPYFKNVPHRIAVIGQSGSGKTYYIPRICGHLLADKNSELIAFVKDPNDRNYINIQKYCNEKNIPCTITDKFDPLLLESAQDKSKHSVVIFDDVDLNKSEIKQLEDLFSKGRQDNISSIIVGQDFFQRIPKKVRDNLNCVFIFKMTNKRDIKRIADVVSVADPARVEMMYNHITDHNKNTPLMLYPEGGVDEHLKIRMGIDGILKKYFR